MVISDTRSWKTGHAVCDDDLGEAFCGVGLLDEEEGGAAGEGSVFGVADCEFLGCGIS